MERFPQGSAFTNRCLTSGFQCMEMLSGKPWSYLTVYFGIVGTVHCMLFGTYTQVTSEDIVWKINGVFRRNPHSDMWQDFFHTLLNVLDCSSPSILRALHCKLASVLQQKTAHHQEPPGGGAAAAQETRPHADDNDDTISTT